MATISLNTTLYNQAKDYAKADGMSVEEWVAMLITRFTPAKKKEVQDEEDRRTVARASSFDWLCKA